MIGHESVRAHNAGDCGPMCGICDFEDAQEVDTRPTCQKCDGALEVGMLAWADDWTVIGADGCRTEIRYTCDDCADGAE